MANKNLSIKIFTFFLSVYVLFSTPNVHAQKMTMEQKIQKELLLLRSLRPDLTKVITPFLLRDLQKSCNQVAKNKKLEQQIKEIIDCDDVNALQSLSHKSDFINKKINVYLKAVNLEIINPFMTFEFGESKKEEVLKFPLLHYACKVNSPKCFQFLLLLGANPNQKVFSNVIGLEMNAMKISVASGSDEIIRQLEDIGVGNSKSSKLLPIMALTYRNDMLKKIIRSPRKIKSTFLDQALYQAIVSNNLEAIDLLLEHGANPNLIIDNQTLFHLISYTGNEKLAELFLSKGAIVDTKDTTGKTPLHYAAYNDNIKMVKLLIDHGANVNISDQLMETPLFCSHDSEVIDLLIENGADINAINSFGYSKIYNLIAGYNKDVSLAKHIIERCPNINTLQKKFITDMFDNNTEHAKLLIANGFDVNAPIQGLNNLTLLHLAAYLELKDFINILCNTQNINLNVKDKIGKTPLHIILPTCGNGSDELLVKYGANYLIRDNEGKLPYFYIKQESIFLY